MCFVFTLDSDSDFSEQSSVESEEESDFELPKEKRKITPKKKCPQKKTTKKALESNVQKAGLYGTLLLRTKLKTYYEKCFQFAGPKE